MYTISTFNNKPNSLEALQRYLFGLSRERDEVKVIALSGLNNSWFKDNILSIYGQLIVWRADPKLSNRNKYVSKTRKCHNQTLQTNA